MESFLRRIAPVWQPHPGQAEFLRCEHKIKVLACGRRWGKTEAVAAQVVAALLEERPTRHLLLAPTLDQATILFERVVRLLEELLKHEKIGHPYPSFALPPPQCSSAAGEDLGEESWLRKIRKTPYPHFTFNGHWVIARSGHTGRLLRGHEASHIVIDEAAFVPEELVAEVAMPMLATTDGMLTLISTPHGHNHFWRFFVMGQEGENGVWSRQAPTSENPLVPPSFLEVQRQLVSERSFAIEYEARFLDDKGRIFKAEAIEQSLVPSFAVPPSPPYGIGVDWARYEDYSTAVVVCRQRGQIRLVQTLRLNFLSWNAITERVAAVIKSFPGSRAVIDRTGIGDVLLKDLRAAAPGHQIEPFVFTNESKCDLIDAVARDMEKGRFVMLAEPQLLRELRHFEASMLRSGRNRLAAPPGYEDDLVCALALAFRALEKADPAPILSGAARSFHLL